MLAEEGALEVLLVHESETDTKQVLRELHSGGYSLEWERVDTAPALREALLRRHWQIVISDSSVPRLGALEALAVAKELAPRVPFIVLAGDLTEEMAVEAMRQGAADCVTKDHLWRLGPTVSRELSEAHAREDLSHRLLAAQEAEARRIARALHDQFGEVLTALKLTLESVRCRQDGANATALAEARRLVAEAMSQARDFSLELWPTILEDLGLAAALRGLAHRHARSSGFAVTLELDPVDRLAFAVETTCFRITQQALTNIARHARARTVEIQLRVHPNFVDLVVSDDGIGFDVATVRKRAAADGRLGLLGMQERAALAGGCLAIDSAPNRGTIVRAHFWLPHEKSP